MEDREAVRPESEEADVEAHRNAPRSDEADEAVRPRRASEDEPDVEGHSVRPSHRP